MYRWKSQCVLALAATACCALSAAAQQPRASLPAQLGWIKFRITAGRLHVINANYRQSKTYESGNPLVGESETLRLNISLESNTVQYRLESPAEQLTVDFDAADSVVIVRTPREDKSITAMTYRQDRAGGVRLIIGEGDQAREHRAASFWQLMLLARGDVEQHLLPVLLALRPGWPIAETADGIEAALVQMAKSGRLPDRAAWAKLVDQLGSSRFSERRSAERRLREAGPAVVAYLKSLPLESFDAERRARIERLLVSMSSSSDDTPARIAMWLIDDPLTWTAVLLSADRTHRALAKGQLEKLLGREIQFDVDADTEKRDAQIAALRGMLATR